MPLGVAQISYRTEKDQSATHCMSFNTTAINGCSIRPEPSTKPTHQTWYVILVRPVAVTEIAVAAVVI
jgi:hypothetical protein